MHEWGVLEHEIRLLHFRGHNQAAITRQGAVVPIVGFMLEDDRPFVIQLQATLEEEVLDRTAGYVELALLVRKLRHDHSHEVLALDHGRRA